MSDSERRIIIIGAGGGIPPDIIRSLIDREMFCPKVTLRKQHLSFSTRYADRIERQQRKQLKRFGDHRKWTNEFFSAW